MRHLLVALSVAFVAFSCAAPSAAATSSPALVSALNDMQSLSNDDFATLVAWAHEGAEPVQGLSLTPLDYVRMEIRALGEPDGMNLLTWLRGDTRLPLYVLGVSDDEIGPRDPRTFFDGHIRALPFIPTNPIPDSNIVVLNSFAEDFPNGQSVKACVSFKNVAPVAATDVVFKFTLLNQLDQDLGSFTLDRTGTFTPGADILTYRNPFQQLDPLATAITVPKAYLVNCGGMTSPYLTVEINAAEFITYRILHVTYADGSTWSASQQ